MFIWLYKRGGIMTNKELAQAIFSITGPANNIICVQNCMTRLRLHVQKEHFVKEDFLNLPGVIGVNKINDEWQIILGPGKATNVTNEFKNLLEPTDITDGQENTLLQLAQNAPVGDGKALHDTIRQKNTTPGKLILKKISNIFIPIIPAFIACGLITGLLNIGIKLNPLLAALPIIQILGIAGNAAFWGLNLFVGISAAKEFGGSPMLGGVMAAIITHPGLTHISVFGSFLVPGRGGIIAVLLVVLFSSVLEKHLHRIIPEMFDLFLTPLIVVLISTFIALFICQPIGGYLSEMIGFAATESIGRGGAVTGFILGGTFLPMVMLGIHQGLTPIHAELLSRYGVTILLPILAMSGGGQVGAAIAVYIKTKNHRLKKTIISSLPVGLMGIGEPLIYGVTLPLGKPFIGACIGGACGGAIQAAYMVGSATLGISGLPLAAAADNIPIYLLGLVTAYISGFIATWIIGFDDLQNK
jgi:sucrose PTS system EIIBCA or EIIBC component